MLFGCSRIKVLIICILRSRLQSLQTASQQQRSDVSLGKETSQTIVHPSSSSLTSR